MTKCGNLWAIGFDDPVRAARFQDEITGLGWEKHYLNLLDVALAVRYPDGSLTLNGEPFPIVPNIFGSTPASFLAGLALWRTADDRRGRRRHAGRVRLLRGRGRDQR